MMIDLMPDHSFAELVGNDRGNKQPPAFFLRQYLPERFADSFANAMLPQKPITQLSNSEIEQADQTIHQWRVRFRDTEGWHKAEVTLGGVSTDELSSKTMGSNKVPGLYFIGEVVDVTGWLGGYNFQWAWASGYAAGNAV
jgi:predicted Rossmann fold flavoprotein